jgi:diacylglycerol O-acyltransferase
MVKLIMFDAISVWLSGSDAKAKTSGTSRSMWTLSCIRGIAVLPELRRTGSTSGDATVRLDQAAVNRGLPFGPCVWARVPVAMACPLVLSAGMDRLTPLDAWFLHVEDGVDHMHMALVSVFEPPCPSLEDAADDIARRLDRIPRYRQRVRRAPADLTAPVWFDDPDFDIGNHVRRVAVRAPGDDRMLAEVVGELVSNEVNRTHPLWEVWLVEGLAEGRWATVAKVHHCLTDGVGGAELFSVLLDTTPKSPVLPDTGWEPAADPSGLRVLTERVADALDLQRPMRTVLHAPRRLARALLDSTRGLIALARDVPPTSATILNGPLAPCRLWWPATTSLEDVRHIRKAYDVTVNDIALTVIAGGLRDLLLAHDELVENRDVRSLVPVSLREVDLDGALHNRVAAMVADLPVGIADPTERLEVVHDRLAALKASHETDATANLAELGAHLPFLPIVIGFHGVTAFLHRFGQRNVNTVTTNVPGPSVPLYWMGRRMERAYPVTPIGESVRVGIAIFSYGDHLTFGVTTDRSAVPDGHVVATGIERDLAALALTAADHRVRR